VNARRRILVVDDEEEIIDLLQEYLSPSHDVDTAVNATQAIERIRVARPDLVFLDINMPGLNGVEALRSHQGDRQNDSRPHGHREYGQRARRGSDQARRVQLHPEAVQLQILGPPHRRRLVTLTCAQPGMMRSRPSMGIRLRHLRDLEVHGVERLREQLHLLPAGSP